MHRERFLDIPEYRRIDVRQRCQFTAEPSAEVFLPPWSVVAGRA
jgi:hypothetical protein